ncbi:hypothetical protein PUN28_015458 [Cardiocondyla obscurior]|uniref:Uncharacterized protein n=1 Tax=Cardiocondyla obscurior TaxID=286306 RepID=A0AAW2EWY4_9HYME
MSNHVFKIKEETLNSRCHRRRIWPVILRGGGGLGQTSGISGATQDYKSVTSCFFIRVLKIHSVNDAVADAAIELNLTATFEYSSVGTLSILRVNARNGARRVI